MVEEQGGYQLFLKEPSKKPIYLDVPCWGELVVFDSAQDALDSLSDHEQEAQLVRLIKIADHSQLKAMLDTRKELCQPKAALYLRLTPSCPVYYLSWEADKETDEMEIHITIPQKAAGRVELLRAASIADDGHHYPVFAKVGRGRRAMRDKEAGSLRPLFVSPGNSVVGGPGFKKYALLQDDEDKDESEGEEGESDGGDSAGDIPEGEGGESD